MDFPPRKTSVWPARNARRIEQQNIDKQALRLLQTKLDWWESQWRDGLISWTAHAHASGGEDASVSSLRADAATFFPTDVSEPRSDSSKADLPSSDDGQVGHVTSEPRSGSSDVRGAEGIMVGGDICPQIPVVSNIGACPMTPTKHLELPSSRTRSVGLPLSSIAEKEQFPSKSDDGQGSPMTIDDLGSIILENAASFSASLSSVSTQLGEDARELKTSIGEVREIHEEVENKVDSLKDDLASLEKRIKQVETSGPTPTREVSFSWDKPCTPESFQGLTTDQLVAIDKNIEEVMEPLLFLCQSELRLDEEFNQVFWLHREGHGRDEIHAMQQPISQEINRGRQEIEKLLSIPFQFISNVVGASAFLAFDLSINDLAKHFAKSMSAISDEMDSELSPSSFKDFFVQWLRTEYECDVFFRAVYDQG